MLFSDTLHGDHKFVGNVFKIPLVFKVVSVVEFD